MMRLSALPLGISGYGMWPTAVASSGYGVLILEDTTGGQESPNRGAKRAHFLTGEGGLAPRRFRADAGWAHPVPVVRLGLT
ncbi:MAG: hypothetical protein QOF79_2155 [Actinomycetota bacterium]|jgi:hypothetical protein|nr:hypothetical protein [Actinomycetota bacterium]